MPICTTCTTPVEYLYTLYESKNNLRLKECPTCLSFADPYVEYDTLTLLLDLILLKRGVYRHLLFNRGWPSRNESESPETLQSQKTEFINERERARWKTVATLGMTLISIDTFIRWSNHFPLSSLDEGHVWDDEAKRTFLKIFIGCMIETITFHAGVLLSSTFVRSLLTFRRHEPSSITRESKLSHIPLTLLYSSFTKLFLLLCLSIWRPENAPIPNAEHAKYVNLPILNGLLNLLDEDKLDRHWVVRNVIGGMAAGFGLRGKVIHPILPKMGMFTLKMTPVALDCHPSLTALIIMIGWSFKAWVSHFASQWLGLTEDVEWMAYSIP